MAISVKGYRHAGDIDIKSLAIITQNGEVIDITTMTPEVNIYQDINEHYLQCDVIIHDAQALINSIEGDPGGFNGGEVLAIRYKSKSDDLKYKTHLFGIYTVSDRNRLDDSNETYNLECISAEAYRSSNKTISRAFGYPNGNLISKMVESIINEQIYDSQIQDLYRNYRGVTGSRVKKSVVISPTVGLQSFIIPNMTPDDAIDFLAFQADCDNHIPYYIFYEDSDGFNFRDINSLVQKTPRETYTFISTNVEDTEPDEEVAIRDFQKIISYEVMNQSNILKNAQTGLYRSKTINIDILTKKKSEYNYDYSKEFSRFNTLQKYQIPGSIEGTPIQWMYQSRTGHDQNKLFTTELPLPKRINNTVARKTSFMRHITNVSVNVTVPGNSEMLAGDVVYLNIPNPTNIKDSFGKKDKYLSGKYLVTRVRHKFDGKGANFTTFMECVKDTGIKY